MSSDQKIPVEPVTVQPTVDSQRRVFLEKTLQENPHIPVLISFLHNPVREPEISDDPPSYETIVYNGEEFNRNMKLALRCENWETIKVNEVPIFANLSIEQKESLWNVLVQVEFNRFYMDVTLKLASQEATMDIETFQEQLEFVVEYLRERAASSEMNQMRTTQTHQNVPVVRPQRIQEAEQDEGCDPCWKELCVMLCLCSIVGLARG